MKKGRHMLCGGDNSERHTKDCEDLQLSGHSECSMCDYWIVRCHMNY